MMSNNEEIIRLINEVKAKMENAYNLSLKLEQSIVSFEDKLRHLENRISMLEANK